MVRLETKASSTAQYLAGTELVELVESFEMDSPVAVSKLGVPVAVNRLGVPVADCMAGMDVAAMVASKVALGTGVSVVVV